MRSFKWNRAVRALVAGLGLSLAAGGCGESEGPVGRPGGRDGVEIHYATARTQVVPATSTRSVVLAMEVRRDDEQRGSEPWAGAVFEVRREEGAARPASEWVTTDSRGIATVSVAPPGRVDRTRIVLVLDGDRRQFLPFDVVSAPRREVAPDLGAVQEVPLSTQGAILRFDLDPGDAYLVMPYQVDDRGPSPYRLLYQHPDATSFAGGADRPPVRATRPDVVVHDRGHVDVGGRTDGALASASVAQALNIRSCRIDVDRAAPLRYLGRHVALYVDVPADRHQARIDSLGHAFDEHIFARNTELFGPTSDYDGNGVVIVVMSPELDHGGGAYCDTIRRLGLERFDARWNADDPIDVPMGTLAHEHQHVINAGLHRESRGEVGDERWLNEGMSYAAEALAGYWTGPLVRMWQFLSGQNGGFPMLSLDYAPLHSDETMMFTLYLYDRFGPDTYRRLGRTGRAGIANVEAVTGMPFETLLRDWFLAVGLGGRSLEVDARFDWISVDPGGMATEIAACRCLPKSRFDGMNLEPLPLAFSFDLPRTLQTFDADYYEVAHPPGAIAGEREMWIDNGGRENVRLALIRIR